MSIQIIGVGFGRTGTLSMQHALNELGFPCYHMFEVLENKKNKSHIDFWSKVSKSPEAKHNWDEVFQNYTATVDFPGSCVWRELIKAYPDAKVILTTHPKGPESWYHSAYNTIYQSEYLWEFALLRLVPKVKKMTDMTHNLVWLYTLKETMHDKILAIERYQQHIEEVRKEVPADKLLEFTVDKGWEPLCQFLNKPVPAKSFPNVNDRDRIKKTITRIRLIAYLMAAGLFTIAASILTLIYYYA